MQELTLNTAGIANGEIVLWVNGVQVLKETGLEFRTTERLKIDGLFFSTFFGGSDRSWSTPVDQYLEFEGFGVAPAE